VPIESMNNAERLAARAKRFNRRHAKAPEQYRVPLPDSPAPAIEQEGGGTAHLCIVDGAGNIASVTTTINTSFGARYSAAGVVMNNEMDDFAREVGASNAYGLIGSALNLPAGGKRPVSTMTPTIVFDGQGPVLCVGGAGGSRIVTGVEQVALRALVLGMSPRQAVDAHRIHHQAEPNQIFTEKERPLGDAISAELKARGHVLEPSDQRAVVQLIRISRGEKPILTAASDSRRGGSTAGE